MAATGASLRRRPILALAAVMISLPLLFRTPFYRHLFIMILLWATLGVAWNMLAGYAGQVSLGHALFFGIGAYSSALLAARAGIVPWIGAIAGAGAAAGLAFVLGFPLFRLSGFYFAIATIALGEIAWIGFTNWDWAGGARGLFIPIKGDSLLYMQFTTKAPYYYLALVVFTLGLLAAYRLANSKAGYYFRAIRDEAEAAISLGVDIQKYKTIAYVFSAAFAAVVGAVYANYVLYIDPDSVLIGKISVQICLITVLGGIGQLWGPLIGAAVLIPISEFSRVYLSGRGRALDIMVYGVLIMIFAVFQPQGLVGLIRNLSRTLGSRRGATRSRTAAS